MKHNTPGKRHWHPIEAAIIGHIGRYGVTTAAALVAVGMKGVRDIEQARDRLCALERKGDLVRHDQIAQAPCFSLSQSAFAQARLLHTLKPLPIRSLDALARAYALLAVCCLQQEQRTLVTAKEVSAHIPEIRLPDQRRCYYLSREANQLRLGFVRVDSGGRGRWDRIAQKACDDMRKHLAMPSLSSLIDHRQFEVCVVTALASKARRIDELLSGRQQQLPVAYRVVSIPNLINFVRPRPD